MRPNSFNSATAPDPFGSPSPVLADGDPLPDAAELGRRVAARAMRKAIAAERRAARLDSGAMGEITRRARE